MDLASVKILAIVPARGGSKGIKKKNLVEFRGKPLIEFTLEAILNSRYITKTIVSTENEEIHEFCKAQNFQTNYWRPQYLSTDFAPISDVVIDVLEWVNRTTGEYFDYFLLLQPTSPMRTAQDIDQFLEYMIGGKLKRVVSVHKMREHPMESIVINNELEWEYLVNPPENVQGRQAYSDNFFFINGSIYGAQTVAFLRNPNFLHEVTSKSFFQVPRSHGLDIDYEDDLRV
jgi:N-acylneuraminate cytidylyltransferase/CMP-N,N'-diacetyllegionaminic acid synthase